MPRKVPPDSAPLDLGISGLLDQPDGNARSVDEQFDAARAMSSGMGPHSDRSSDSAAAGNSNEPVYQPNQFELLAKDSEWAKLSALCEAKLPPNLNRDESFETVEVRCWWIKSQIELRSVPFSILLAPLEEVCGVLASKYTTTKPSPDGALPEDVRAKVRRLVPMVDAVVVRVIAELSSQGESDGAGRLKSLRSAILAGVPIGAGSGDGSSAVSASVGRGADTISGMTAGGGSPPASEPRSLSARLAGGSRTIARREGSKAEGLSPGDTPIKSSSTRLVVLLWAGALCLVFALLLLGAETLGFIRTPLSSVLALAGGTPDRVSERTPLSDGLTEPALVDAPIVPIKSVDQLQAILEDFKQDRARGLEAKSEQQSSVSVVGASSVVSGATAGNLPSSTGTTNAATGVGADSQGPSRAKDTISTSGPIEPRDFPRSRQDEPRDVARDTRVTGSRPGGSTGAVPRAPDRPGFEEFSRPRRYLTLVEADIMSAPSIRARYMDSIPAGAEVLVEAKEGYWLKIRSQRGNVGFILSQDAIPK